MASVSLFGGGFFYAPFSTTFVQRNGMLTGALANTFGGYATLVAATPAAGRWIEVQINDALLAPNGMYLLELAQGAAGAEVPWIPSAGSGFPGLILETSAAEQIYRKSYSFPVSVPAGIRISGRVQCNNAGAVPIVVTLTYWG